ncbi:hypothetical protein Ato02nite_091290 [Paractinoplanes toevensis]|uniref:Uncharacterized protein n=1 Tax=Paractinoplanes toevensis TaxID=571911 RepID=A0A920BR65_9ACTN|nr:hypothetical protein Ato02nite_091290 [Actinoplanes toevensis]
MEKRIRKTVSLTWGPGRRGVLKNVTQCKALNYRYAYVSLRDAAGSAPRAIRARPAAIPQE